MIGNGPCSGFKVAALSIEDIRASANNVRRILGINEPYQNINIGLLLDKLNVEYNISYDVLEPDEMPHPEIEACWDPNSMTIYIRSDVFQKACCNDPRGKFTVTHELGHCLLGHRRTINRSGADVAPKVYEDSEWQANQFAAEFLMPLQIIQNLNLNDASKIKMHFDVSLPAATNREKQLKKRGELSC